MAEPFRWLFRARVPDIRDTLDPVHDGDTLRLQLDRGASVYTVDTLRLKGVFAPELKQLGGTACLTFVWNWILSRDVKIKWPFIVETFKTSGDRDVETLDRYVATVTGDPAKPTLNQEVAAFIADHPEWKGGVGG